MKMNAVHIVPLASQAVEILRELHPRTGPGKYVFHGARTTTRPMSESAVLSALRRLGYTTDGMTGPGVRASYNYAEYLPERKRMMQQWADYLDHFIVAGRDTTSFAEKGLL